ncbi:hypothetical protein [Clostridium akagii]|uniref:hypothetical protein n=1 Tax=Clostridium akagii TaxID=91623 RepID=UPI00047D7967|nr:hypothetical protein [Clostridium akagii]
MKKISMIIKYLYLSVIFLISIIFDYYIYLLIIADILIIIKNININSMLNIIEIILIILIFNLFAVCYIKFIVHNYDEYTSITFFYLPCRSIAQRVTFKNRKNRNLKKLLYKSFCDVINDFLNLKLKILGIKIRRMKLDTHTNIIKHILSIYGVSDIEKIALLQLDKGKKDRKKRTIIVDYNNKKIVVTIKFLKSKILVEQSLIYRNPYKYIKENIDKLKVDNYSVKLIVKDNIDF